MTKFSRPIFEIMYGIGSLIRLMFWRITWKGDMSRRAGPALLVGKHASYWDITFCSIAARRIFRTFPHFEMGTFFGYPLLGRVQFLFERYGSFTVMRPKDLIRIKHATGKSKEELSKMMQEVNDAAAAARRWVLESGRAMVYYPEGGRSSKMQSFRSKHEMQEAIDFVNTGRHAVIFPIVMIYDPAPRVRIPFLIRRNVTVHILEPIDVKGRTADDVLDEIHKKMSVIWTPEAQKIAAEMLGKSDR